MYLRWAERRGFEVEMKEASPGEEAGLKSATFIARGENAYGLFAAERGVHRLVRISPFDSSSRRHTSFAQVDVGPLVDAGVEVEIDDADLRIDTYRASGAGGQHVNKTDSAVRITHLPTGVVVQCQNERSQTQNKAVAMQFLRSKLIELEERKRAEEMARARGEVKDVAWGSQIRSYVLHPYTMVKDHRTEHEVGDVAAGARRRPRRVRARLPEQDRRRLGLARWTSLVHLERAAAGEPEGLLVLHHGRGTDERDLLGLADALDPEAAAAGGDAAGAAELPGSPGYHWYLVPRVGYPDPETFDAARAALAELHDRLWEETGRRARADRPRRLLDGVGDELRDGARRRPAGRGRDPRLQRLRADGRRLGALVRRPPGDPGLHRPRPPRPDHRGRVRPAGPRSARGGRARRSSYRESDIGHQIDPAAPGGRDRLAGRDAAPAEPYSDGSPGEAAGGGPPDVQLAVEEGLAVAGRGGHAAGATVKPLAAIALVICVLAQALGQAQDAAAGRSCFFSPPR